MKDKHTPLPWIIRGQYIMSTTEKGPGNIICDEPRGFCPYSQEKWKPNAAFIVHACNNIERVEAVNRELSKAINICIDAMLGYGAGSECWNAVVKAHAALEAAKSLEDKGGGE